MKPLKDNIILKMNEPISVTEGGLEIPLSSRKRSNIGVVVSMSDESKLLSEFKEGDVVRIGSYAGKEISVNSIEYLLVPYVDVYGID